MEKVRALFVCDIQLGERMKRIADARGDVEVVIKDITHLDMDKLTLEINQNEYDVFISRGEAATALREQFDLPVIEVPVSDYDILKILTTLSAYPGKKAIVFHESLLGDIRALCELMQYSIDIFKIQSTQEGRVILKGLQEDNYSLIIGGYTIVRIAKQMAMNGIVIQSGDFSINQCLNSAINTVKQIRKLSRRAAIYEETINCFDEHTLIFRKTGKRLYSSVPPQCPQREFILDTISALMPQAVLNTDAVFYRETKDTRWVFHSRLLKDSFGEVSVVFRVREAPKEKNLLENVMTVQGFGSYIEPFLNPFDGISKRIQGLMEDVQLYGKSDCSVLIVGADGTGKGLLSEMLHMYSRNSSRMLIKLHCELLTAPQLDRIFGETSVFQMTEGGTIILSNVDTLNTDCQKKLYQYLSGSPQSKNFRLIATASDDLLGKTKKNQFLYKLYKRIAELQLVVPTLRERPEDIEGLVSILIGTFNQELATDVIGLEKKALEALKNFDWEFDIDQLKRVIRMLMLDTEKSYITAEETQKVLDNERAKVVSPSRISREVDFSGTLDEIEVSIIKAVLQEENMNQSRAAKRLGISRNTMWRRLK